MFWTLEEVPATVVLIEDGITIRKKQQSQKKLTYMEKLKHSKWIIQRVLIACKLNCYLIQ